MIYAPIIIPTLNRKEHLRNLIESIKKNPWADKTHVVISIDYPPSEKYRAGWIEVNKYLDLLLSNNDTYNFFANLTIIKQETNLGVSGNFQALLNFVQNKLNSDEWIYSEDDNIFAPNFIEYIDKGLDLFKNDPNVLAVCGCHGMGKNFATQIGIKGNAVKTISFSPYGFGTWKYKYENFYKNIMTVLLSKKNDNFKTLKRFQTENRVLFTYYVSQVLCGNSKPTWNNGKLESTDIVRGIYNYLNNTYSIAPVLYKSHTDGNDGSGVNMPVINVDPDKEWPLDKASNFDYELYELNDIQRKGISKCMDEICPIKTISIIKLWIRYIIYRLCQRNRQKTVRIFSLLKI